MLNGKLRHEQLNGTLADDLKKPGGTKAIELGLGSYPESSLADARDLAAAADYRRFQGSSITQTALWSHHGGHGGYHWLERDKL
jgi:hypothetical protein